jgi:SAM-dependent methyltransferase
MTDASKIRLKERLVAFWNTQQLYWDGIGEETCTDSPNRVRATSFIPDGSRVLDVACGSGANAQWLKHRTKYLGCDISKLGLQRVQHVGVDLVCADAEALPFSSGSFDAAISTYALEHSVRPVQMLFEISRVVRPGGRVVLLGPSWDLPFWYPNSVRSRARTPSWRLAYTWKRLSGQIGGWILGRLPFLIIEEPEALNSPFVYDADAVYVVWAYEVIRQLKRWGLHLVHGEVDDRMLGLNRGVRILKRLLYSLPPYSYAGSTLLLVFER